jgi:ubiquinone biosynthesis protein COQ4
MRTAFASEQVKMKTKHNIETMRMAAMKVPSAIARHYIPYQLSLSQRLFLIPYFGIGAMYNPERGDLVAGLGDTTAEAALRKLHQRMVNTETGRQLLESRPLIDEVTLDTSRLRQLPENTLGKQYMNYMDQHGFSADERTTVRFMTNPDHAYIMTRYRQVHDFWHVLSGLPPTVFGEIALKWLEYHHTGLPVCFLSGSIGPLRLGFTENRKLWRVYYPWAVKCAAECNDLLSYRYEDSLEEDVDEVRRKLKFLPAPKLQ